jgi:hypothetical protein
LSAIDVLCEIIAQGGKARAASFCVRRGYSALLDGGYLRETGMVQAICCQDCDDPHDAEVVFDGGQYGILCPDLGFVPLSRGQVAAVVPDLPRLVADLADAFDCKRRKTAPLQGEAWRVGAVETAGGDVTLYFHPRLKSEQDLRDLRSALSREVKSPFRLILTADGGLPFEDAKTAQLCDVVELNCETSALTATVDPGAIVGAPVKRVGGTPNIYGETLTRLIRSRVEYGIALPGRSAGARRGGSRLQPAPLVGSAH